MVHRFRQSLRCFLSVCACPRLVAQAGVIQHRPFQRRALWQALDFGGKPRLEGLTSVGQDSSPDPVAHRLTTSKYARKSLSKRHYFKGLLSPYFFQAVRSFGECGAERDQNRPGRQSGSQELFARKPANTGDFERSEFEERALPKG